jgi:hypothetical protein
MYYYLLNRVYFLSILVVYFFYIAVFIGIFVNIPNYIKELHFIIQIGLCFILMIRFHPFQNKYVLSPYDISFIFGTAVFLFTNVILVELVKNKIISEYLTRTLSFLQISNSNSNSNSLTLSNKYENKTVL